MEFMEPKSYAGLWERMSGASTDTGMCGAGAVVHGGQTLVEVEANCANPTFRGAVARGAVPRLATGGGAVDLVELRPMWVAPVCIVLPFVKRTHLLQKVATTLDPSLISNPSGMMCVLGGKRLLQQ